MTTAIPSAYGSDISTFVNGAPDLDPTFGVITGLRVVAEDIARRLMTPVGSFEDDPRYGYDLREELGTRVSPVRKIRIAARIVAQCLESDLVQSARVTSIDTTDRKAFRVAIVADAGTGPFDLVLGVDSVTVALLRVGEP